MVLAGRRYLLRLVLAERQVSQMQAWAPALAQA
jgi:hypothetical protein